MTPFSNEPISLQYGRLGEAWADAEAAARAMEEAKTSVLAQRMMSLGDMPVSKAEMQVKASKEWQEYIRSLGAARTKANKLKIQLEVLRMRHSEWINQTATERHVSRL
jgi:hypothetical protein